MGIVGACGIHCAASRLMASIRHKRLNFLARFRWHQYAHRTCYTYTYIPAHRHTDTHCIYFDFCGIYCHVPGCECECVSGGHWVIDLDSCGQKGPQLFAWTVLFWSAGHLVFRMEQSSFDMHGMYNAGVKHNLTNPIRFSIADWFRSTTRLSHERTRYE